MEHRLPDVRAQAQREERKPREHDRVQQHREPAVEESSRGPPRQTEHEDRERAPARGGLEVEPGVTSGDYLAGFLLGTREALAERGRESITITVEDVDARSLGGLIALYERAVGLYAWLVNVNAYHQPGVEAGKKAAQAVIALQARVLAAVKGPANTKGAATPIGAPSKAAPAKAGAAPGAGVAPGGAAAAGGTSPTGGMLDKYTVQPKKVPRRKPPIFGAFDDDNSLSELKKPFKLPKTVKVVSVQTADDIKPITTGEASIYFFPQGHTQLAHIQIEEIEHPENAFTIIIKPLTGRVEIQEGKINLALTDDPRLASVGGIGMLTLDQRSRIHLPFGEICVSCDPASGVTRTRSLPSSPTTAALP